MARRKLVVFVPPGSLDAVRDAGMEVCCGGIVGMGESRGDRVGFIHALATLPEPPESVPINALVPIRGTPLGDMLADVPGACIQWEHRTWSPRGVMTASTPW